MIEKRKDFEKTLTKTQKVFYRAMWIYLRNKGIKIETVSEAEFEAINGQFIDNCIDRGIY